MHLLCAQHSAKWQWEQNQTQSLLSQSWQPYGADKKHVNTAINRYLQVDVGVLKEKDVVLWTTVYKPGLPTQVPASHFPALTQTPGPSSDMIS